MPVQVKASYAFSASPIRRDVSNAHAEEGYKGGQVSCSCRGRLAPSLRVPFTTQAPADRPFWDIDAVVHPANLEAHFMAAARSPGGGGALLLTNPHNPTGLCYGAEALRQASEWAHSKGLQVIIDEVLNIRRVCGCCEVLWSLFDAQETAAGRASPKDFLPSAPIVPPLCWMNLDVMVHPM